MVGWLVGWFVCELAKTNQPSITPKATYLGAGILAATAVGWYTEGDQAAAAMTGTPSPETRQIYNRPDIVAA
jgi:hypothetical protein